MTKQILLSVLLLAGMITASHGAPTNRSDADFVALCYHDIVDAVKDNPNGNRRKAQTVSTDTLIRHFNWLQLHGYKPVSFQQIVDARQGITPLPEKAVLLTFDDGYRSFHSRVLPLLKLYGYPAVLALTGTWLDAQEGSDIVYGEEEILPREAFLTWSQLAEIRDSGLVEIASHSYNLHHGELGNPFGNIQPAATTRIYDDTSGDYEDDPAYRTRLLEDLTRNNRLIRDHLGITPRVLVWPYGAYSGHSMEIARQAGLPYSFTLDGQGHNRLDQVTRISRLLMEEEIRDIDLETFFKPPSRQPTVRVAHVDIDYLYDEDKRQQARNMDLLIERIKRMGINTVYLQAFADPDGDGNVDALYFPNRHLPVRADLFNRVAWQLKTRSHVSVYAWMPVLAFELDRGTWVESSRQPGQPSLEGGYRRLSPFDPDNRRRIGEIYEDLAKHAHFDGLLFHDDAYLTDAEDISSAAREALAGESGSGSMPLDTQAIARFKTDWLIEFTQALADRVRYWRGGRIMTARNIYARLLLEPESETWFAQSFPRFIESYDYTAVMAMPFMEGEDERPDPWLTNLARTALDSTDRRDRIVFELQSTDWRNQTPVPAALIAGQMRLINRLGIHSYGYYPDDFINGHPALEVIEPAFSLSTNPYGGE